MFNPNPNDRKMRVCANCHRTYIEGDKYCRYCGAPMGEPAFIPEDFACIYGPPPCERVHTCQKCGYTWKTNLMIDDERWCPECGGAAPVTSSKEEGFGTIPQVTEDSSDILNSRLDNKNENN